MSQEKPGPEPAPETNLEVNPEVNEANVENEQGELQKRHMEWIVRNLKALIDNSPFLETWKKMDFAEKGGAGVMMTCFLLVGSMVMKDQLNNLTFSQLALGSVGGILGAEITARTHRYLSQKFGKESEEISQQDSSQDEVIKPSNHDEK